MLTENYQQIITACFPDLTIRSCRPVAEGWDSVAMVVNNELIFRFPKRRDVEPQYQIEHQLLPALASALPLPIPDVAFFWPGGAAHSSSFIGQQLIEGVALASEHLTPEYTDGIAQQLGRFLSALHRFPIEQATQLGVPAGDQTAWYQRYCEQYEQIEARVLPLLPPAAQARIIRDWQAFLSDQTHFQVALIHHDLAGEHILYSPVSGTINGVIDWGDTAIGDPAIDFTGLLADYGKDFTERVLAHYQGIVDASFRSRMRFYLGWMPLNTVLFGLDTGQKEFVREGLGEITRYQ
jgi:aminoglycoside 2''-phosphotransferase